MAREVPPNRCLYIIRGEDKIYSHHSEQIFSVHIFFSSVIIWDYFYPLLVLSDYLPESTFCSKCWFQSNSAAQAALEELMKKWNKN